MAKKLYGTDPNQVPTNADLGTMAYQDSGNVNLVKDSGAALNVDRKSDDGDLAIFSKDGTTVGSIGSYSGGVNTYINSSGAALSLRVAGGDQLTLTNGNLYPTTDSGVNLGLSNRHFGNLHLSGGIIFNDAGGSGTSSSNTFDSYEEGTWTPSYSSASGLSNITGFTNVEGKYVKIGDIVHAVAAFDITRTSVETISEGDYIVVSGLPVAGEKIGVQGINGLIGTAHIYGALGSNVNGTGFVQLTSTSTEFYFFIQHVNGALDTADHCFVNLTYST